jgi:MFS family permease
VAKFLSGHPARIIAWTCVAHVASMTGFSAYPALLPLLQGEWGMSNTEAGFVSGLFFAGYMAAVPVLTALTDRVDARRIYLVSSLVAATASAGFARFAQGTASAGIFQLLVGVGIAGTYMPGLRALTDNTFGKAQSRAVSFYTAFFGVGVSLSLVLTSEVARIAGWRAAFLLSAIGPLVAAAMLVFGLPPRPPHRATARGRLLDFRPVLANRAASRYIYGYAVHCWELFGSRSWMVAFLTYAQTLVPAPLSPAAIHAVANLASPFASVAGNEAALRIGRAPVIVLGMMTSGALTCVLGFGAPLPWLVVCAAIVLHMVLVMSDSSTLTAGMVAESDPRLRGATMAVHSTLGFGTGFVAPLVFGAALDLAGGNHSALAWGLAFVTLGAGAVVAPAVLRFARRADR